MSRRIRRWALSAAAIAVGAAGVIGWHYWFSTWTLRPATGEQISVERSWGCLRRVVIDQNSDGRPEAVSRYEGCLRDLPGHGVFPAETWVDEGGKGSFNLHLEYAQGRGAIRVRRDEDRDGSYELDLSGEQAAAFEKQWMQQAGRGILNLGVSQATEK